MLQQGEPALVWYDDSKGATADKIQQAIDAYVNRYHERPTVVSVNKVDAVPFDGIEVRSLVTVQPNTFFVARETGAVIAAPESVIVISEDDLLVSAIECLVALPQEQLTMF